MPQCLFRRTRKTEKNQHVEYAWVMHPMANFFPPVTAREPCDTCTCIAYSGGGRKRHELHLTTDVTNVTTNITSSASMQLRRFLASRCLSSRYLFLPHSSARLDSSAGPSFPSPLVRFIQRVPSRVQVRSRCHRCALRQLCSGARPRKCFLVVAATMAKVGG